MLPAIEKLVKNLKPKYEDDVIDRLNYAYTSSFFVILILVIGAKQYVGEPLQCWLSAEYKSNWEKYIENYCFVENTYYVNNRDVQLPEEADREKYQLKYYQWVPVLLILQLLLFLAPKTFWSAISWKTGLNVRSILGACSHAERQKKILSWKHRHEDNTDAQAAARQIHDVLEFNEKRRGRWFWVLPPHMYTQYYTITYILYKLFNFINTLAQLWMMNQVLNTSYRFWGIGILRDLIRNRSWEESGHFPRVTYCDFMRRDDTSSRPMTITVQCVLMINMFNEKLYIILWFWFVALTMLNLGNLIFWTFTSYSKLYLRQFIQSQLNFAGEQYTPDELECFITTWVYTDGFTALRLIASNAGDLASSDIIAAMFHSCKKSQAEIAKKDTLPKGKKNGGPLDATFSHAPAYSSPPPAPHAPPMEEEEGPAPAYPELKIKIEDEQVSELEKKDDTKSAD